MRALLLTPVWNRKQGDHYAQWTSASIPPTKNEVIDLHPEPGKLSTPHRCNPLSFSSSEPFLCSFL